MWAARNIRPLFAPVLVGLAVLGYLVGVRHGASASTPARSGGSAHVTSGQNVILEYPGDWTQAKRPGSIPGLTFAHQLTLVPRADPAGAGLVSGQLPPGSDPLPNAFVTALRSPPSTEVLDLLDVQAYKYGPLQLAGDERTMLAYLVPTSAGRSIALVCYAHGADSGYLRQCSQIVATLSLVGEPAAELRPDGSYGASVEQVVSVLDSRRAKIRRRLGQGPPPARVGALAAELAARYAHAAGALGKLEAPLAAAGTQSNLLHALKRARDSYVQLSEAVRSEDLVRYETSRESVEKSEAEVNLALEGYSLLGYGRA